jgi:hypothetical protein
MKDIALYETGNGGDLFIENSDVSTVGTLTHQVYIALFGGNVEASTKGNELETEKRNDWWANSLIFKEDSTRQFNSETERILNTTALNSSGRIKIERAVKNDLKFLSQIINLSVLVQIISDSKINIIVSFQELQNGENKVLQFLWDNLKKEIIIDKTI